MQEFHCGKADTSVPLKVVIQFAEAIPVPADKAPRDAQDPIMSSCVIAYRVMIEACHARPGPFRDLNRESPTVRPRFT